MIKIPYIIVILGATATGKTKLAVRLAKDIGGEIISADSRQIYKGLDIGTGKDLQEYKLDNCEIAHHLIDIRTIDEPYSVYDFQRDAIQSIEQIMNNNKIPIVCGGTGLYIDAVVFNYKLEKKDNVTEYKDRELITEDIKELQKEIGKEILDKLNEGDRNNPRRLQKILRSGLPSIEKGEELNHLYFFLDIDREILKERISKRVNKMFESGLLEENIMVREKNLEKYPALQTIGYQEFDKYFEKEKSLEEVKEDIITHTNQYAKRQRTWFRRNMKVNYIKDYKELEKKTLAFISKNR